MAERSVRDGASLLKEVAATLRASLNDPRCLAEELIRKQLGCSGRFLGEGRPGCPWVVFDRAGDCYALYLRGQELVQKVHGQLDEVVCVL